jgi:hypothetical protein
VKLRLRPVWLKVVAVLAFLVALGIAAVGGRLVEQHANSNAGSVDGWILIALGIFGVIGALAYLSGAYNE